MAHTTSLDPAIYTRIRQYCTETLKEGKTPAADELLTELMDLDGIPIHYPYHHFIMPAALLTLASIEEHVSPEALDEMLVQAQERAMQVPGGACGNFGSCGNAVGAGIFLSIYTDTTPLSAQSWQWVNEITGRCLLAIAQVPGPRCCKRTGYLSLQASVPYVNEKLGLHIRLSDKIVCHFHEKNAECKKELCPFYHPDEA